MCAPRPIAPRFVNPLPLLLASQLMICANAIGFFSHYNAPSISCDILEGGLPKNERTALPQIGRVLELVFRANNNAEAGQSVLDEPGR